MVQPKCWQLNIPLIWTFFVPMALFAWRKCIMKCHSINVDLYIASLLLLSQSY